MSSALLALFIRALREDVRSKSMYWARGGLVGIVLLNLGTTQLTMGWAGAPGLVFFNSVVHINLFFISLAGLSYFSSAITEEKEDMTLGLLRMTNLNPLSILLGKSASRQIGALLLLISQFPFTLLAVALGGVTLAQIIAAYSCLAAYTLFLGNLALFFSVMTRRSITAAIFTFCVLFGFLFGSWIVRYPVLGLLEFLRIIPSNPPSPWLEGFLTRWQQASPITRLGDIGITGFSDGPLCFQVLTNVLLGGAFFLGAWAIFDVFCSEQPEAAPSRGLLTRSGKRFRIFSPSRPWRGSLLWKDYFFLGGGHIGALVKLVIYSALLALMIYLNRANSNLWEDTVLIALWVSVFVISLEVAFIASRVFRQERVWKTWSSLAMLPMSTRRIAYQKIAGCLISVWPALVILGSCMAFLIIKSMHDAARSSSSASNFGSSANLMAITGILFAVIMVLFFYHLVVALSLRLKWGALPLAFAITYVGTSMLVGVTFLMFREASFLALDLALAIAVVVLHHNIGHRLEQLAAED